MTSVQQATVKHTGVKRKRSDQSYVPAKLQQDGEQLAMRYTISEDSTKGGAKRRRSNVMALKDRYNSKLAACFRGRA
jgi:hypothetical protein